MNDSYTWTAVASGLVAFTATLALDPIEAAQDVAAQDVARGLIVNAEGIFPGYTLMSPLLSTSAFLIDRGGEVVHEWKTDFAPGGAFHLLDNGHLLRLGRVEENPKFNGGGIGGLVQEFDWDGELVWEYFLADEYQTTHHDIEPLPNGNVLMITWEYRYTEDAIELGRDPEAIGPDGIWPDAIIEVEPTGLSGAEIVWEWHSWDHLIQDFDPDKTNYGSVTRNPQLIDINVDHRDRPAVTEADREEMAELADEMAALGYGGTGGGDEVPEVGDRAHTAPDWLHMNSVSYNAEYDLIAVSSPNLCEIWVIDHSTTTEEARYGDGGRFGHGGDLLFRWGNPRNYGAGDDESQRLFYQHNPTWVAGEKEGELRLLVFNNGARRPGGDYSSVDELVLPFDPKRGFALQPGEPFGPLRLAWRYADKDNFFSGFISGAQRLPNGNTLICEGAGGRIFEVTREREIVWEYRNTHGGEVAPSAIAPGAPPKALFRATRIAVDHPGLAGRL